MSGREGDDALAWSAPGRGVRQGRGRWLNGRAGNSHHPFRRREDAKAKFRDVKTLQMFATVRAPGRNRFNRERRLFRRDIVRQVDSAAVAERRHSAT